VRAVITTKQTRDHLREQQSILSGTNFLRLASKRPMDFSRHFPWTNWICRRLTSKKARVFFLAIALVTMCLILCFRIQSILFERRVRSVLGRLAMVHIEDTSAEQLQTLFPELTHESECLKGPPGWQPAERCYSFLVGNWPNGPFAHFLEKFGSKGMWLYLPSFWMGHRFFAFSLYLEVRNERLSKLRYEVTVDNGLKTNFGLISVDVTGTNRAGFTPRFAFEFEDIREYEILTPSNVPYALLHVTYVPAVSEDFIHDAFDLHLKCVWDLSGCRTTLDLLPTMGTKWPRR
jgi:hypothetical protein